MSNLQDLFDTASPSAFKNHSEETRAKISKKISVIVRDNWKDNDARREAMSQKHKGKVMSTESRAKISANNVRSKPVMTPVGEFPSLSKAAQAYNTGGPTMSYWIKVSKKQEFCYTQK